MTDTQEAMREFEKIYLGSKKKRKDGEYAIPSTRNAFLLYQAATAQSAEKIARLEEDIAQMTRAYTESADEYEQQLAAAELSNRQYREALEFYANNNNVRDVSSYEVRDLPTTFYCSSERYNGGGTYIEDGSVAQQALAQQPSTEALDAYVATKSTTLKIPSAIIRKDFSYIGDDKFTPEIIITFPACGADDSASWNNRDNIARMFNTEPLPPAPEQKG